MNAQKIKRTAVDFVVFMAVVMGFSYYLLPVLTGYFKPSIMPVILIGSLLLWILQKVSARALDRYFGKE